jgi:hypothetical protein
MDCKKKKVKKFSKIMNIRHSAYKYYFYFMQERMKIFWKRYDGLREGLTQDKIFRENKFTNVYRSCDRVSQYLIRDVIYNSEQSNNEADILLRIIVFKIFNKIETWELIKESFGEITINSFDVTVLSNILGKKIKSDPIFNGAYMMTGSHQKYRDYSSKHEKWLRMVEREIIQEKRLIRIINSRSLEQVFCILRECSFIGDFLAYQYAIDLNYSSVIDFNENSFVKAGIGAIRGIKKCFTEMGRYTYEDCIRFTQENLEKFREEYGFEEFKNLFGREPQLIDLQNCFCETDKYLRVKVPDLQIDNIRIKQKFKGAQSDICYFFPPKWGINQYLKPCSAKNSKVLTLF